MIANALRAEIEAYAVRMPVSNPLFVEASNGTFAPASMLTYLANIRYIVGYTKTSLSHARDRARALGDERLAEHYEHKRVEELGHEVWADDDIVRLSKASAIAPTADILPAIRDLVRFLEETIEEDPALYLAYALFAEYLTVILGPAWLRLLEERCGIPRSSMTVIGNHIELDREHAEEAFDLIDLLVADPRKLARMREVLQASLANFDRFCGEVTERATAKESRTYVDRGASAA